MCKQYYLHQASLFYWWLIGYGMAHETLIHESCETVGLDLNAKSLPEISLLFSWLSSNKEVEEKHLRFPFLPESCHIALS